MAINLSTASSNCSYRYTSLPQ